ncbi:MAG: zinc carboxypeptidase, partial [Candidatus Riflebacteria bacterium]|nr:zinc carboxypeptidase [Candidatus Riflebacteria bacterium]
TSKDEVKALARSGADIVGHGDHYVEVVAPAPGEKHSKTEVGVLAAVGLFQKREVLVEDIDTLLEPFKDRADLGVYHTVKEVQDELTQYAKDYASICHLEVIGKSCEDRDLQAIVIGPQSGKAEGLPKFFICGAHHSREWISVEVPMALIKKMLTTYATDPEMKALVDSRIVWILPLVNPDGVNYSQTQSRMWRKNRRKNSDGSYGVDPNRNYGYEWGDAGSSNWPGADTYHGPKGFSEPETSAVRDLARREKFAADISFHSYSELVLWPWSYTEDHVAAAKEEIFKKFGAELAKFTGYVSEKSSDLYPSAGDYDDFMFGDTGALSFTIELGQTFIPSEGEVPRICEGNVKSCLYLIKNCEDPFPHMTLVPTAPVKGGECPVEVELNTELYPQNRPSSVTAVCATEAGKTVSHSLDQVARGDATYAGKLPAGVRNYHLEYQAADGSTVRFPKYRELSVPGAK